MDELADELFYFRFKRVMRIVQLTSIALLMVVSSVALEYEPTWRRADWFPVGSLKISSVAIDDYSVLRNNKKYSWTIVPGDLHRSVLTRNAFVEAMGESLKKKYPSKNVVTPYNFTNSNATVNNFKSALLYHSNIVFIVGHGRPQQLGLYDELVDLGYKAFGGDIKWVFIDACEVLNVNKNGLFDKELTSSTLDIEKFNKLKEAFIGVHAILGYYSHNWLYPNNSSANANYRSELKYKYFAKYFIEDGLTIWDAYKKAHQDYYKEIDDVYYKSTKKHIIGYKPAIAYMKGTDQCGRSHDASTETYEKTYEVALDPRETDRNYTLNILYQEFGAPEY